ncbi:MAG: type II toxin-antitoxin system prevent-host-death family antitoxin [Pseudomonadota bacterium]
MQVPVSEAKAQFAELIRRAEAGEAVVITRHGRPVVELRPSGKSGRPADFLGSMAGQFTVPEDINDGDAEIEAMFQDSLCTP